MLLEHARAPWELNGIRGAAWAADHALGRSGGVKHEDPTSVWTGADDRLDSAHPWVLPGDNPQLLPLIDDIGVPARGIGWTFTRST